MAYKIRRATVLGAGLMGSQIAAHLANVGIPVDLLDVLPKELTPEETKQGLTLESPHVRNRFANGALKKLQQLKPAPLYDPNNIHLIRPGNFADHLSWIKDSDWVIEAVVESLPIKRELWAKVAAQRNPKTIVSSNTSGISIKAIAEGLGDEFERYFLGTHFFNPPRYLRLLELIPTQKTEPAIIDFLKTFGERTLGKGVVIAKDTPNFIANRIGTYAMMVTLEAMAELGLSVEEVDAITGRPMGRPKSATFRTLDVVGLDTFALVAANVRENVQDPSEQALFSLPAYFEQMLERGWYGQKAKQGFYKKEGKEILALNLETLEYAPRKRSQFASLEMAKLQPTTTEKLKTLINGQDKAAKFAWATLKKSLLYAASKLGEIADDVEAIDQAMRWGFNWEHGPFETWDALGLTETIQRMEAEGEMIPQQAKDALEKGGWYADKTEGQKRWQVNLVDLKKAGKVVRSVPGASLIDLGDEVLALEMHSPKAAIGTDIINLVKQSLPEVSANWRGLVITAQSEHFCVGANVMMILMEAQDEEWDTIDWMVREFQGAAMGLKYLDRPVVAAPYNMTLGGGFEISAGADAIQAHAELYLGLVEVGVGLIPGGGGNKEMWLRALERLPASSRGQGGAGAFAAGVPLDLQPVLNQVFETIGMAKVSTSAAEAKQLGYLRPGDGITMNRDHLLYDAKARVLALDAVGYRAPAPSPIPVLGRDGRAVLELGLYNMHRSGFISDHDLLIGKKLAYVLTGGDLPAGSLVSEQYLLDIEREAFLSLTGEPKSQARMQHILTTGKPLRN